MRFGSRGPSEFATEMPWRSHTFAIEKKISSPRERPKWKWVLVFTKKALYLTCVRSQTSREIKNATIREFSTSLKSSKSREQFLLRLTFFLPYLRLTVKIFQFLRLSTKFLAVLRLSVNPIKTFFWALKNPAKNSVLVWFVTNLTWNSFTSQTVKRILYLGYFSCYGTFWFMI